MDKDVHMKLRLATIIFIGRCLSSSIPEFPTEIVLRELFNSPPLGIPATTSPQKAISRLSTSQVDVKLRMCSAL